MALDEEGAATDAAPAGAGIAAGIKQCAGTGHGNGIELVLGTDGVAVELAVVPSVELDCSGIEGAG